MGTRTETWAIMAGGGTAGHVAPAIAIAQALVAQGCSPSAIHFLGSRRGLEVNLVPEAGFALTALSGRGIVRKLSLTNFASSIGLALAVVKACLLVARLRPAVMVSVGGYAALPGVLAAAVFRVPLVLVEPNAVPGAANLLGARFATASAVAFEGTALPKSTVTGTPVRAELLSVDRSPESRAQARRRLALPQDRKVVAVLGGSLGARRINQATLGIVDSWSDRGDLAIRHALGARGWKELSERLAAVSSTHLVYQPLEYEMNMDLVYAAANLVVCRSGAATVAELAVVGIPSILVPLPNAPADHQAANAHMVEQAGGAVVLRDDECTSEKLSTVVDELISDSRRLKSMEEGVMKLAHRNAASEVAQVVIQHAKRNWSPA